MGLTNKIVRTAKKTVTSGLSWPLKEEGFSSWAARIWVREIYRDWRTHDDVGPLTKFEMHRRGYLSSIGREESRSAIISQRDYLYVYPINKMRSWLRSRIRGAKVIPGFSEISARQYANVRLVDGDLYVTRLADYPPELSTTGDALLELIRVYGPIEILPARWNGGDGRTLVYKQSQYFVDGWPAEPDDVLRTISKMAAKESFLLQQSVAAPGDSSVLRTYLLKTPAGDVYAGPALHLDGDRWKRNPPMEEEITKARISGIRRGWEKRRSRGRFGQLRYSSWTPADLDANPEARAAVENLTASFSDPALDFLILSVDLQRGEDGRYFVTDLSAYPKYPPSGDFGPEITPVLESLLAKRLNAWDARRSDERARRIQRAYRRRIRRSYAFRLRARGFTGKMARSWVRRAERDLFRDRYTISQAQRHEHLRRGFLPSTAMRFAVTEENRNQFISDRDYSFAHPLNGKYSKWVRDRVSTLEVFRPFRNSFEAMDFQLLPRDGKLQIIPLSSRAQEYPATLDGLLQFVAKQGPQELVPSTWRGSQGRSIELDGESVLVDGYRHTVDEVRNLLFSMVSRRFYVTKPASRTEGKPRSFVRVIIVNDGGTDPQIAEAYRVITHTVDADEVALKGKRVGPKIDTVTTGVTSSMLRRDLSDQDFESAVEREENVEESRSERQTTTGDVFEDEISELLEEETAGRFRQQQIRKNQAFQLGAAESNLAQFEREPLEVEFISPIDPATGDYSGARALIGRQLFSFGTDPVLNDPFSGTIKHWSEIVTLLKRMSRFAPQLEFVEYVVDPSGSEPVITGASPLPTYGRVFPFAPLTVDFLRKQVEKKRAEHHGFRHRVDRLAHNSKLKLRRMFAEAVYPEGLVPYQSVRWLGDVRRDLFMRNGVPLRNKLWAYRHGFLSYRLPQYGINEDNRTEYISDLEYRWLRHINKKYKYWLEDKVSIKYVASSFNEFFPEYYFYTSTEGTRMRVVPMMDLPSGYENSLEDILRLVQDLGVVALKPEDGSHGDGFYRFEYLNGEYLLNGEKAERNDIEAVLANPENKYLITEFIQMHPELARIYPHSVNTLRLVVFKRDGKTPQIGNAYLRIGSSESGFIDNTAAGGMMAEVDPETGVFGNGQVLENGRVRDCPRHPDTGELIEGQLPNWELVKEQVLAIADAIPQLEYMGFDVALTEEGIKLPEINRFPDYPRINKLTPETTAYLLEKVAVKKREYGYDKSPNRSLISLPPRERS